MYFDYLDRQVAKDIRNIGFVMSQSGLRLNDRSAFLGRSVFVEDGVMMEARRGRGLLGVH